MATQLPVSAGTSSYARPYSAGRLAMIPEAHSRAVTHLAEVDALLDRVVAEIQDQWDELSNGESAEILDDLDVPDLLRDLLRSGGKRIRPTMCHLGWLAVDGQAPAQPVNVVTVSAALELLHLFALVHDDVMDESDYRRGRPSVHRQAEQRHAAHRGTGDPELFGISIAILVGDLALAEAGNLVAGLPEPMRRIWRLLVSELVIGQRQDLAGTAARRRDLPFARSVAALKSGRYTVQRPLELGAIAAKAPAPVLAALTSYGRAIGDAFALRDDVLGLWGDPARTGKPAGDDLITGKPTMLLAMAESRTADRHARHALGRVGTPGFTEADLAILLAELDTNGTRAAVEALISEAVAMALGALDERVHPDAVAELTVLAHTVAWRKS